VADGVQSGVVLHPEPGEAGRCAGSRIANPAPCRTGPQHLVIVVIIINIIIIIIIMHMMMIMIVVLHPEPGEAGGCAGSRIANPALVGRFSNCRPAAGGASSANTLLLYGGLSSMSQITVKGGSQ
jgi:hypothetical protein